MTSHEKFQFYIADDLGLVCALLVFAEIASIIAGFNIARKNFFGLLPMICGAILGALWMPLLFVFGVFVLWLVN